MKFGCIGYPVSHSLSPKIHRLLGNADYSLLEVKPGELASFFRSTDLDGFNVTIPHKSAVIPYLSGLSERAAAIGAVNTVVRLPDGGFFGDNTDFEGLRDLILKIGVPLGGKRVAILGTGGTSRTALAVAREMGASEVFRVSRSGRDGILYSALYERADRVDYLINTTPVGMLPHTDEAPVELSRFPHLSGVCDAVYNPLRTKLVQAAEDLGIPSGGGLWMLVSQAVRAAERFGYPGVSRDRIGEICREVLSDTRIPILIGMPGSGKSTLGAKCAERMGRVFVDLDREIERDAGKSIPSIFESEGEAGFRSRETVALKRALSEAADRPILLATGGGTPTVPENVFLLRQNGKLLFLDRPLSDLIPTADRPLSGDRASLEQRYRERLPLYRKIADATVSVEGSPASVCEKIILEFSK